MTALLVEMITTEGKVAELEANYSEYNVNFEDEGELWPELQRVMDGINNVRPDLMTVPITLVVYANQQLIHVLSFRSLSDAFDIEGDNHE